MSAGSDLAPVLHIERELRHLSIELTQTKPGECLQRYVYPHARIRLRRSPLGNALSRLKAPRATALHERLMSTARSS
jgi:hypothetical protein